MKSVLEFIQHKEESLLAAITLIAILQADKIKADTAEAQRQAESEALRKEEENKASAANAQRDYEREIEEKLLNLPLEPSAGDPDAITVLIRSPKGQKFGRR